MCSRLLQQENSCLSCWRISGCPQCIGHTKLSNTVMLSKQSCTTDCWSWSLLLKKKKHLMGLRARELRMQQYIEKYIRQSISDILLRMLLRLQVLVSEANQVVHRFTRHRSSRGPCICANLRKSFRKSFWQRRIYSQVYFLASDPCKSGNSFLG